MVSESERHGLPSLGHKTSDQTGFVFCCLMVLSGVFSVKMGLLTPSAFFLGFSVLNQVADVLNPACILALQASRSVSIQHGSVEIT